MKIALSVPHTPAHPGAGANGVNEYGLGSAVIGDLIFKLTKAGHEAWLIGAESNSKQIEWINTINADCGLELHFNSFTSPELYGTETLHAGSMKGEAFAECIQKALVERLGTKNKGIMVGHFRGNRKKPIIEMLTKTNCPFVIPEPLFLSNPDDFAKIDIHAISDALFKGLESYQNLI